MRPWRRDEAAYVEYVASRQRHLLRVAYALCGEWSRAEDLLQTALAKLYVAWPGVHRDGREDAYVRQILVRSSIDAHRRGWVSRERSGLGDVDPGVPDATAAVDDRSVLFAALQSLPEMQRKTVVLRHWLGLSVEETATELGITAGTVKSHTARGLARLQDTLASDTERA
jgi:RNA polymerase sigma-70 factor (sigma-E family)